MARRKSQSEQLMLKITAEFEEYLRGEYPGLQKFIPSWTGVDLYADIKKKDGSWLRVHRVIADDGEVAGVRELA